MPTYIYETIEEPNLQFEVKQSMHDTPLTHHPETGAPVRRVISGGYGLLQKSVSKPASKPQRHGCGGGCGCGNH
ncbi:MAG: zinc ribbon domain-containing protein [Verrucomicrobiota bacterium]